VVDGDEECDRRRLGFRPWSERLPHILCWQAAATALPTTSSATAAPTTNTAEEQILVASLTISQATSSQRTVKRIGSESISPSGEAAGPPKKATTVPRPLDEQGREHAR
jgi:hypothetical protein